MTNQPDAQRQTDLRALHALLDEYEVDAIVRCAIRRDQGQRCSPIMCPRCPEHPRNKAQEEGPKL